VSPCVSRTRDLNILASCSRCSSLRIIFGYGRSDRDYGYNHHQHVEQQRDGGCEANADIVSPSQKEIR
jgi:hypothetical protein